MIHFTKLISDTLFNTSKCISKHEEDINILKANITDRKNKQLNQNHNKTKMHKNRTKITTRKPISNITENINISKANREDNSKYKRSKK